MDIAIPRQFWSQRPTKPAPLRRNASTGDGAVQKLPTPRLADEPTGSSLATGLVTHERAHGEAMRRLLINLDPLLQDLADHADSVPDSVKSVAIGSLANALRLTLELLPRWGAPEFALDPDFEVSVEWFGRADARVSVSVAPDGHAVYAAQSPDRTVTSGTFSTMSRAFSELPRVLKEVLE